MVEFVTENFNFTYNDIATEVVISELNPNINFLDPEFVGIKKVYSLEDVLTSRSSKTFIVKYTINKTDVNGNVVNSQIKSFRVNKPEEYDAYYSYSGSTSYGKFMDKTAINAILSTIPELDGNVQRTGIRCFKEDGSLSFYKPIDYDVNVSGTTATFTVKQPTTGTFRYSIDNGATYQTSNTFNDLEAGSYTVKVKRTTDDSYSITKNIVVFEEQPEA